MANFDDEDINLSGHNKKVEGGGYVWEEKYYGSWEMLDNQTEEEAIKNLQLLEQKRTRKRITENQISSIIRRGIIRYVYLVLDLSLSVQKFVAITSKAAPGITGAAGRQPPGARQHSTRHALVLDTAMDFVKEFFDQNPLSQLGIIVTRDGLATRMKDLCGKPEKLVQALKNEAINFSSGVASLQNALSLSLSSLTHVPGYATKEVIVVYSSLTTCDPGDIFQTIEQLKQNDIRSSVVQFDGELHVARHLTKETKGSFTVPYDSEQSFRDALFAHVSPPPTIVSTVEVTTASIAKQKQAEMIMMGFPQKKAESAISLCTCHNQIRPGGFTCPRCASKYCELPNDCTVCGLKLVSSPHLARSYHHLFPVNKFIEIPYIRPGSAPPATPADPQAPVDPLSYAQTLICYGCQKALEEDNSLRVKCPSCSNIFCVDCDAFIHESLHNCPGCESGSG